MVRTNIVIKKCKTKPEAFLLPVGSGNGRQNRTYYSSFYKGGEGLGIFTWLIYLAWLRALFRRPGVQTKIQDPKTKLQINTKLQAPKCACWELDVWILSGSW